VLSRHRPRFTGSTPQHLAQPRHNCLNIGGHEVSFARAVTEHTERHRTVPQLFSDRVCTNATVYDRRMERELAHALQSLHGIGGDDHVRVCLLDRGDERMGCLSIGMQNQNGGGRKGHFCSMRLMPGRCPIPIQQPASSGEWRNFSQQSSLRSRRNPLGASKMRADPERWRRRGGDVLTAAATMHDAETARAVRQVALGYRALAEHAERYPTARPPSMTGMSFGPEAFATICQAYDDAWRVLSATTGIRPEEIEIARVELAAAILALAGEGGRDVSALRDGALQMLALGYRL
jgi:hypothetical protein